MYNLKEKLYIWLDGFQLPIKKREKLLLMCGGIENLVDFLTTHADCAMEILGYNDYFNLKNHITDEEIEKVSSSLERFNQIAITIESDDYPDLLKEIENPPFVLYTRGDLKLLKEQLLGIVGTRRATSYGREVTCAFTKKLENAGVVTVSGLAYGIDTCVAQTSVDLKKPTIAVLAGGLDNIYPSQNNDLANSIVACGGLLVSERPPLVRPTSYSFLDRNRIISGISFGVLVVEAGERSGALSTANYAVIQNRELFVLPGNITSSASIGCNNLIKALPTCFCISADQILHAMHIDPANVNLKKQRQFSMEETIILNALEEEMDIDEIQEATGLSGKTLISTLTGLEISGIIKKTSGNYYAKITLQN